jgi:hypothetical protein
MIAKINKYFLHLAHFWIIGDYLQLPCLQNRAVEDSRSTIEVDKRQLMAQLGTLPCTRI